MNTPDQVDYGQLEVLMRDPLAFFQALSTFCHEEAASQSDLTREFPVEEFGPGKPWRDTTPLIDLAIELWREEGYPNDVRRRVMTSLLERINALVQSYAGPER